MMKHTMLRLISYSKTLKRYVAFSLAGAFVSVAFTLLIPLLTGRAVDYIVGKDNVDFQNIGKIIGLIAGSLTLSSLFQWVMQFAANKLTYKIALQLRTAAFNKLNTLPLGYIDTHPHGDILSRVIVDVEQVSDGLLQAFTQFFTSIITIAGTLVLMFTLNVTIALVVVIVTPLSLLVAFFITRRSLVHFKKQSEDRGRMTAFIEEMCDGHKTMLAFNKQEYANDELEKINQSLYKSGFTSQLYGALVNPVTRFVNYLVYVGVGVVGAILAVKGTLTVGELSCFLSYANQYTKPFNEITGVVSELQSSIAAANRLFELIDTADEPDDSDAEALSHCDGTLVIDNVSFGYTPDKPLIKNFNLKVEKGQRIAIVGPTGAGKTTVINLLMRFYDVNDGVIYLSGKPVPSVTRNSLRSCFGMVLQESWLFEGTYAENIAYGKPDATMDEIVSAAKSAHIHDYIVAQKDGYDTVINDGISAGQKQLICIARIMLTLPPMLILDEATSNIDARTELNISRAFDRMMKGRTCFIVAHRLSTIKEADVILVMDKGNIIEYGTHKSLMEKGGFYYNLYNSQFRQV